MSNSIDLLMIKLENQMFTDLCNSCKVSGGGADSVSFSDMLDSAVGASGIESSGGCADTAASDAGGMSVSDDMVKFIEEHEGFSASAYNGVDSWNDTIGYGHVVTDGESIGTLTQSGAVSLLKNDLKSSEASVNKEFEGTDLTQSQFDALTSFAYNLGANIWSETPKLVSDIKSGASSDVIKADFENCSSCNGNVVQGLVNRRLDEWNVYANGDYA